MTIKRTFSLQLRLVETFEVDADETPSSTFPAAPAIDTTGHTISETTRPLAKVVALHTKLKRLA